MPIDDAIGDRLSCAPQGQSVSNWRRPTNRVMGKSRSANTRSDLSQSMVIVSVTLADVAVMFASTLAAIWICTQAGVACAAGEWLITALTTVVVALEVQRRFSAYSIDGIRDLRNRLFRTMAANLIGGLAGTACLALLSDSPRALYLWLPVWLATSMLSGSLAARFSAQKIGRLCDSGRLAHHVAVVGAGAYASDVVRDLCSAPGEMLKYAGTFGEGEDEFGNPPIIGLPSQSSASRIDAVVLCVPISQTERIARLRAQLRALNCDIYVADDFFDQAGESAALDRLGNRHVMKVQSRALDDWQLMQKALLDRLGAAALLILLAPFLALIALAIALDSSGPILFRQPRAGLNNRSFTMFKFRTMYHHHEDVHGDRQTVRNDPRVTRLGRLLRRTSLDELPQLLQRAHRRHVAGRASSPRRCDQGRRPPFP